MLLRSRNDREMKKMKSSFLVCPPRTESCSNFVELLIVAVTAPVLWVSYDETRRHIKFFKKTSYQGAHQPPCSLPVACGRGKADDLGPGGIGK